MVQPFDVAAVFQVELPSGCAGRGGGTHVWNCVALLYVFGLACRLYRGDWSHGHMHGCGTAIWKQHPGGEMSAAEGKFFSNEFVGDVMPCSKEDGYDSAVEADMAAYQARSFLQVGSTRQE